MWAAAAALLSIPAIAMQFTSEVDWSGSDFIVMGIMLGTAFGTFDLASRMSGSIPYRAGAGVAVARILLPRLVQPRGRHHRIGEQSGEPDVRRRS